jgi:hypothetical protein
MTENEIEIRSRLKNNFVHYADKCLKIRTKQGLVLPFKLNKSQLYSHKLIEHQKLVTGKVRVIALKGRQCGFSTYTGGRIFHGVSHRRGVRAFILTHEGEATSNLFEMSKRFYDNCPQIVRPALGACSAKELSFTLLDSGYKVGTAGNAGVGRSSTIQYFHGSEVALWENASEHAKGILQAIPGDAGTEIILESTARGVGNYFHEQWQQAESGFSEFIPIFLPWFWQDEYQRDIDKDFQIIEGEHELIRHYDLSAPQLIWRRKKIIELSAGGGDGLKAFNQEYPNNAVEAFTTSGDDTYISPNLVMAARKTKAEGVGKLIIGADPARFGDDRTSIIFRRGRCAYNLTSYTKKDTMEVAGILYQLIKDHNPDRVCVDIGGLGAGVVDRLHELVGKELVIGINAGSTPLDQSLYSNKRAEMWGLTKQWLEDKPSSIPDSDSLHADLCNIKYSFDSNSRLKMEPKETMKKRGVRSSDEADALGLTFALPFDTMQHSKNQSESVAAEMMQKSNTLARLRSQR